MVLPNDSERNVASGTSRPQPGARRKQPHQPSTTWIGQKVHVVACACKDAQGFEGRVVDETKFTVTLDQNSKRRQIQKAGTWFYFPVTKTLRKGGAHMIAPSDQHKK